MKLLHVLESGAFLRVGGSDEIRVDVRIVAASNRDLSAAVQAGCFRRDLMYRLAVFPLEVPPLRERRGNGALSFGVGTPLADAQREIILATLDHYGGDKRRAARVLGVSLKTLYNRLDLYGGRRRHRPAA